MDAVEIRTGKAKVLAIGAACMVFLCMAAWLLRAEPGRFAHLGPLGHPLAVRAAGVAGLLFFGAVAVFALVKLVDTRPGLVVGQRGIDDHSSALSIGFIPWHDVAGVKEHETFGQPFMVVLLKDSGRYLERVNPLLRWMAQANVRLCGSPVAITANGLETDHAALKALLEAQWARHRPQ